MKKRRPSRAVGAMRVDLRVPFVICVVEGLLMLGVVTVLAYLDVQPLARVGLISALFYALTAGITCIAYSRRLARLHRVEATAEQFNTDVYRLFRTVIDIPYAVVNRSGMVRIVNDTMEDILGRRSPVCNIPLRDICSSVTMEQIAAHARRADIRADGGAKDSAAMFPLRSVPEENPVVRLNDGRRYLVDSYLFRQQSDDYYFLIFRDVNDYMDFVDRTNDEHPVMAYIVLDNLQELTQFVRANYRATANEIESTLRAWVEGMNGMIREYDRDKYFALFSEKALDACVKDNFSILGNVMNIRVGDNSFPVSVSMGIADIDGSMIEREQAAKSALEMALQRGGNQVALQRRGVPGMTYYGGTHKTLETNTSITSRVSATLLEGKLTTAGNVLIMGHSNPDFDAIGSAVGLYRLCRSTLDAAGKIHVPVHVVVDRDCDTFATCREYLRTVPEYDDVFLDKAEAQLHVNSRTVLLITDVSNPVIFEAPQLINGISATDGVSAIAVFDHHRLVSELPFVPFIHYIETTKSSASEIIAEVIQQSRYADSLLKEEANLLLAGIMLDTHNFTRSAGARTFEITHYLYSRNAHTDVAKEFFNEHIGELRVSSEFDAHTTLYQDVFAITWLSLDHEPSSDDRIAASKAADKLLGLRGVEASFAMAVVNGNVIISGRSKGKVNVQLILEKLDGGGHFDMAGAQVGGQSIPHAYTLLKEAIDEYVLQNPQLFKPEA